MFISGMVLWQTEGSHALIGLWVLGMLVFIPGFYFTCASASTHCLAALFALLLLLLSCLSAHCCFCPASCCCFTCSLPLMPGSSPQAHLVHGLERATGIFLGRPA